MRFKAHGYQERAIGWIEEHERCLLFLDMGLGKTVSTLTAVQRLLDHAEVERVLVVAPKKVAEGTWSREAEKWDHLRLRVSVVMGSEKQRERALEEGADVYVTSRDQVVWLAERYGGRLPFDMVVIDELTSFKNHRSLRFRALRRCLPRVRRVVGLTGTPTPNGLKDLWAQVYCIDQGERLGRFVTEFRGRWFHMIERNHIIIKMWPKEGAEEEIRGLIGDIALTMRAEDWLELPALIEKDVPVELGEKTLAGYRRFEKERVMEAVEATKRESMGLTPSGMITAASAGALLGKLSQYANGAVYDDAGGVKELHVEKLAALGEILEATEGGLLCFYQYQHDRDRIMEKFSGYGPRMYEGQGELDDWNAGKIRLLLAHPASTAFGLNMQDGGSTIVWFSTGWNLELYEQANARLHRQGQERPVVVHRLIARGTVDERMAGALGEKGESQRSLVMKLAGALLRD